MLIKLFRPVIYTVLRKHWAFHILYKRVVFHEINGYRLLTFLALLTLFAKRCSHKKISYSEDSLVAVLSNNG